MLERLNRYSFTIAGIALGIAVFGFLFLRTETRKETTKIESRVKVVEKSPCTGLTKRQCVLALVAALNDKDLASVNKRLESVRKSSDAQLIRSEVKKQIAQRKKNRSSGGVNTTAGTPKAPFRPSQTNEPGSTTSPGSTNDQPGPAVATPEQSDTTSTPSESPSTPSETPTTPAETPSSQSPPPVVTVDPPPITIPVTPTVDVPPVTVPCISVPPITNCG